MKLTTCLLPEQNDGGANASSSADVAVVIDVLRATSVMATALSAGAVDIVTCCEIEEALGLCRSNAAAATAVWRTRMQAN